MRTFILNGAVFNNNGMVNVTAGTLSLEGGDGIGSFSVDGALNFTAAYNLNAGSSVSGGGSVNFVGGTTTISGNYTATGVLSASGGTGNLNPITNSISATGVTISGGQLNLNVTTATGGGTLSGGVMGGSATFTCTNTFNWTGGAMAGDGVTVFPPGPRGRQYALCRHRQRAGHAEGGCQRQTPGRQPPRTA